MPYEGSHLNHQMFSKAFDLAETYRARLLKFIVYLRDQIFRTDRSLHCILHFSLTTNENISFLLKAMHLFLCHKDWLVSTWPSLCLMPRTVLEFGAHYYPELPQK